MNTKVLLIASTVFSGISGAALTFLPNEIIFKLNLAPNPLSTLTFQLLGALLLGFSMLNWMNKDGLIGSIYSKPLVVGNFMHFGVGVMALVKIISIVELHSVIIITLTVIYAVFAILFAYVFRTNPSQIE
jgi:drug/metabolite transporter (DMT)-like permease